MFNLSYSIFVVNKANMIKFDTDIFFSKLRNEMKDVLKEHDKILTKNNSDEDDFIFEKGCIYEIRVTIGNKILKLLE